MEKKRFRLCKYNLLSQSMFNQHRFFILNSIKLSPTCISLQAYTFHHVATCMSIQKKTHIFSNEFTFILALLYPTIPNTHHIITKDTIKCTI